METTIALTTEDFGKWNGFANYARTYNRLATAYVKATGATDISTYDLTRMPNWGKVVWHQAKNLFEQIYSDTAILAAVLSEFDDASMASRSEVQDLIQNNLRRVVFSRPDSEVETQNSLESLFVGRGYQKGADYDRETGRVKFSGKEFVPDFVFHGYSLAVEVKLLKDDKGKSKCVEEMAADVPAYLSKYESVLFVVYDLGAIQDVAEFQLSFQKQSGVRVSVVKH